MTTDDIPRAARIAWRAAEILEEVADHTADSITRRILPELGLCANEHGDDVRTVVSEVMSGTRVVDLRRAGHFAV